MAASPDAVAVAGPHVRRLISSDSVPAGGFTPGTILLGRYRIVGLLGRGGMGEVYRADDLKLGQAVALKFLPSALADDPVRRERFFAEVRITRQVSHPNICRVYDIAELEKPGSRQPRYFLTMEYIDGEDLASLLQRIGYLSNEKALDIARQLVAGLAAAHERGVLHRDLKPANIMVDGRGRVRITDFGLAVAADESQAGDASGTPAYMAPEQLAGKGATVRSDIYALGLVLYELYTGKRAFTAATLPELREQKENSVPVAPSDVRGGVDPVVERVIARCLERDPRSRPGSVPQVAAALPGGDPLAAAIAAGETPSPEMVAASGGKEGLEPRIAVTLVVLALAAAVIAAALYDNATLIGRAALPKSSEALAERARAFVAAAGYATAPRDQAYGFFTDDAFIAYLRDHSATGATLSGVRRIAFWYRESPQFLARTTFELLGPWAHSVTAADPPMQLPGNTLVRLDADGRLREFIRVPANEISPSRPVNWDVLFEPAGFNRSEWKPDTPRMTPPFDADEVVAWTGVLESAQSIPARIEAAAAGGKPVWFLVSLPWTQPFRSEPAQLNDWAQVQGSILAALLFVGIAGAAFFAYRNVRSGRGDRRGASRLFITWFGLWTPAWLLSASHVPTLTEVYVVLMFLASVLLYATLMWLVYVALEPFVRRRWPHMLVAWTRLLGGEWRDPAVGRDVLVGCTAAACVHAAMHAQVSLGYGIPIGGGIDVTLLGNTAKTLGAIFDMTSYGLFAGLTLLFFLFFLRVVLRNDWAAATLLVIVLSVYGQILDALNFFAGAAILLAAVIVVFAVVSVFVVMRFGLLAAVAMYVAAGLLDVFPITLNTSAWYSGMGYVGLTMFAGLLLYGFRTSLGGRRVFEFADV